MKHLFYILLALSALTAQATNNINRILYTAADTLPLNLEGRIIGDVTIAKHTFDAATNSGEIIFTGSLTKLNAKAFINSKLKTIILPASLASVGDSAFALCQKLSRIVFQSPNAPSLGRNCLDFDNLITIFCPEQQWEQYQSTFKSFVRSGHVKKLEHCIRYTNTGPEKEKVSCTFNEDVVLHTYDDVNKKGTIYFADTLFMVGMAAFKNSTSLQTVSLPDHVSVIENNAFEKCTSLDNILLPESLIEIQERAFAECTSLEEINVPNNVIRLGKEVFRGCTDLKKVSLGYSMLQVGANCLYGCSAMDTMICHAVVPPLLYSSYVFKWMKPDAKLFVPKEAIDLYEKSDWGKYYSWEEISSLYDVSLSRILYVGETINLSATVVDSTAKTSSVTWSSSNDNVAEVDNQGRVVAKNLSEQPVEITATLNSTGLKESVSLVVRPKSKPIPVTYNVNVQTVQHGSITVNQLKAQVADEVLITVAADAGWQVESVSVTDTRKTKIPAYRCLNKKNTYQVMMPASDITVTALIVPQL